MSDNKPKSHVSTSLKLLVAVAGVALLTACAARMSGEDVSTGKSRPPAPAN